MSLAPLAVALALLIAPPATAAPCLLAPVRASVTRGFEQPSCRWCAGHRGLRYATHPGASVFAAAAGRVSFAGTVAGRAWVTISVPDGRLITVGPLLTVIAVVGQQPNAGDVLGRAGSWLMLTVRATSTGEYLDPAQLVVGRPRPPRLVPEDGRAAPQRASPQRSACAVDGGASAASR